jgi:hypothetical protein
MFTKRPAVPQDSQQIATLTRQLAVGDLIFIRVRTALFLQVAEATGSWTNHVGIVTQDVNELQIAESRFPLSGHTTLRQFVRRSAGGRVAVARLRQPITEYQRVLIARAARRRARVLYDTGFDLHSRRQYCSRFVREVIAEATGVELGAVQTFEELLQQHPDPNIGFWKLWYFGRIPWQRRTVTPASLLRSPDVECVFDGAAS